MATTPGDLSRWFDHGIEHGATHMLVIADMFDGSDFPIYVMPGEDVRAMAEAEKEKPLRHIMEVYALHVDKQKQLGEYRAFHFESP